MKRLALGLVMACALMAGSDGCKKAPETKTYAAHGVVQGFQAEGQVIILQHDKIEGLMEGMTMGFELKDPAAAKSLKKGDKVDFSLEASSDNLLVTQIAKAAK